MKVFNNTDRALLVERWTIFPKSTRCVNQQGQIREELPNEVGYGSVIRRLEALGAVTLPSFGSVVYAAPKNKPVKVEASTATQQTEPVVKIEEPKKPTEKRKKRK